MLVGGEDGGEEADLAGFAEADEVALGGGGGGEGLEFFEALPEAVKEGAVGEGDIGEAGAGDAERGRGAEAEGEEFHEAFAGAHEVDGVGGLVGGDAEIVLGDLIVSEPLEEAFLFDEVGVDHLEKAVGVLLGADVFKGGKVEDVIVAGFFVAEEAAHDGAAEIDGEGAELDGGVEAGVAEVADEFGEVIFALVDDVEAGGFEWGEGVDGIGADAAGAADDEKRFAGDFVAKFGGAVVDVGLEEIGAAAGGDAG